MDSRSRSRQWQTSNGKQQSPSVVYALCFFAFILFTITATLTSYQMTSNIVNHFFGPINFSSDGKSFYKDITFFFALSLFLSNFLSAFIRSSIPFFSHCFCRWTFFPFSLCPSNINRTNNLNGKGCGLNCKRLQFKRWYRNEYKMQIVLI